MALPSSSIFENHSLLFAVNVRQRGLSECRVYVGLEAVLVKVAGCASIPASLGLCRRLPKRTVLLRTVLSCSCIWAVMHSLAVEVDDVYVC